MQSKKEIVKRLNERQKELEAIDNFILNINHEMISKITRLQLIINRDFITEKIKILNWVLGNEK